jgi:NAD(P)-dependent dehydrogenase (short-subunit alcohol dehydrogenase family)
MADTASTTTVVTGGTGGLGQAVLTELLDRGLRVVASWMDPAELERMDDGLRQHEGMTLVEADIGTGDGAARLAEAAGAEVSGIVCLAGGFAASGPLHEAPADEFDSQLELNLGTAHRTVRALIPAMLDAGGSIVLVGTRAALEPFRGGAAYAVSKAAVISLAKAIDADYRDDGIRANAILPSVIDTPANRTSMPDADHDRWVSPAAIAKVIAWLLSADSAPTSGAAIPVYGRA